MWPAPEVPHGAGRPVACGLLPQAAMLWLAIGAEDERGEGMDRLLPQLAAILRVTSELERRLAGDGIGGLAAVRELHRRIVDILTTVAPDVARARETVDDLVASLHAMEERLAGIRRLKIELGRAP